VDWSDLRFFLAVARQGTLSGAARVLKVDQSTVSRRLTALEESLGARLMERTPAGYLLTSIGQGVREAAERIEAEAIDLERRVSGHDARLEGIVRVTTAETFGSRFVAPLLVEFHKQNPGIELEIITDNRLFNLSRREAELAIRMTQPDGNELLVRRLGTLRYALYASPDYLARFGEPDLATGLAGHEVIEYLEETDMAEMRWVRRIAPQARRCLRSTTLHTHLTIVLGGGGIGVLPCFLGDGEPGLRRLTDPMEGAERGLWIAVHRDLRNVPRIRSVADFLAREIKRRQKSLEGATPTEVEEEEPVAP
jgi:DNA-binding transcriptional LysR family regulator